MSGFKLKERVQKIFSLADIRVGGNRQWDLSVNNETCRESLDGQRGHIT